MVKNILDQMRNGERKPTHEEIQVADKFLQDKPCQAIIALKNRELNGYELSETIDSTYSHVIKLTNELDEQGLVKTVQSKNRQEKKRTLTSAGENIAEKLYELNKTIHKEAGR